MQRMAGLDVLDFRDGNSRRFFADGNDIYKLLNDAGGIEASDRNGFVAANAVLQEVKVGKEYYFVAGSHAAIVRKKIGGDLEYLELQSGISNGFKQLSGKTFADRFKVKKSRRVYGSFANLYAGLIDVELLADSHKFKKLMGFINTEEGMQKKGEKGSIK